MSQHPISEIPNLHLDTHYIVMARHFLASLFRCFLASHGESVVWSEVFWQSSASYNAWWYHLAWESIQFDAILVINWLDLFWKMSFVIQLCDISYINIYQIYQSYPSLVKKLKSRENDNMFYYMEFIKHRSMELSTWDHLPVCMAVAEIMNRQKTSISISQYIIDTLWISNCVINFVVLSKTFNLKGTTIHSFSSHLCRIPEVQTQLYLSQNQGPHGPWLHHK